MDFVYICKLASAASYLDRILQPPWKDRLNCNEYLEICRCRNMIRDLIERESNKIMRVRSYPTMDE